MVCGRPVEAAVRQQGGMQAQLFAVKLRGSGAVLSADHVAQARMVLERMLGLGVDIRGFYRLAERDERLRELARRF